MSLFLPVSNMRIASEVVQFSAVPLMNPLPSSRHPGLDPGSIHATPGEWTPDQVRGDENHAIANEVAQFSGPFA